MTAKRTPLAVSVPTTVAAQFRDELRSEGKTISGQFRVWIDQYLAERETEQGSD